MKRGRKPKIPCEKNECLVYAACKQRRAIICEDLYEWIEKTGPVYQTVRRYLPNVRRIASSKK